MVKSSDIPLLTLLQAEEERKYKEAEELRLEQQDRIRTRQLRIVTASYCCCYAALGLAAGALGPTIDHLAETTGTDLNSISDTFTARGVGWVLGSVIAGKLYEKFRGHRILAIALIITSISMLLTPFIPNIWVLLVLTAIAAAFMSWIEVGVNTLTLWIWKDKVAPYMQLLHFAFGAGLGSSPAIFGTVTKSLPFESQAIVFYVILAILIAITALWPLKLISPPIEKDFSDAHAHMAHGDMLENTQESQEQQQQNAGTVFYAEEIALEKMRYEQQQKLRFWIIVPLVAAYLFMYGGLENAFGSWAAKYAKEVYDMEESEASYLDGVFWAALTVGRLISVPLSTRLSARILLLGDMLGCIFALIIAILFEHFKWSALLWICTVIYGACMASIFATAFTIPVELRLKGSSKGSSAFIVASGIGDMALPVVAGKAITFLGPTALLWLSLGVFCFCLAVYMVLFTYGLSTMEKKLNDLELREIESLNDYWN